MLELAFLNQEQLREKWYHCLKTKLFFYYFMSPYASYSLRIEETDWNMIQYVSKDNSGEIIGFFTAYVNNVHQYIENLDAINFTSNPSIILSRDVKTFFDILLIQKKFRKIVFHAITKNPAFEMYIKMIRKYQLGKMVGILKENRLLPDGLYYDEAVFEIYRKNYLRKFENKIIH